MCAVRAGCSGAWRTPRVVACCAPVAAPAGLFAGPGCDARCGWTVAWTRFATDGVTGSARLGVGCGPEAAGPGPPAATARAGRTGGLTCADSTAAGRGDGSGV